MIYIVSDVPIKIPASYLMNTEKLILKSEWKGKGSRIASTILEKTNRVKGQPLSNFKIYSQATSSMKYGTGGRTGK